MSPFLHLSSVVASHVPVMTAVSANLDSVKARSGNSRGRVALAMARAALTEALANGVDVETTMHQS